MIAQRPPLALSDSRCGLMDHMDSDGMRLKVPRESKIIAIIKTAVLLGLIFMIVVPSTPSRMGIGLDSSWVFGLNMGHFDKMIFGRDIIFTYGPLGYLLVPTFPEAEPWAAFAFTWGIALVTAYALWRLSRYAGHWTSMCLYLGVFWLWSAFALDFGPERMLAAIVALTLAIAIRLDDKPWFDLGLLFFLAGVAVLTKFNLGIIASGAALYFEAWILWRRRSTVWLVLKPAAAALMVWPATVAGLYWMLDGTPWGLAAFLRNSVEIARGYEDAMSLPGPLWPAIAVLLSWLVLWIGVPLLGGELRRVCQGVPLLFFISFMCYKSAMVRQDAHALPFPFEIAMAALLMVALAPTLRNRIVVGTFAVASIAMGIVLVTQLWPQFLPPDLDRLSGRAALRNLNGFLHWKTTVETVEAATERDLIPDQLPAEFAPYLTGKRVSTYPWEIAMIRANHLRWRPLPVIQAYSAYTPALDLLNAEKLEDTSGPEDVLLSWSSLDERQPLYETPRSWRELFNWYDIQLTSPELYVLHRRSTPRFGPAVPFGTAVAAQWDQTITLPPVADDEVLVMEADVGESLRGILKRILVRSTAVNLQVTLRSGHTDSKRVVRVNLKNGVLVSDWLRCLEDIAPVLEGAGGLSRDRVVSISFCTPAPSEFDPAIRIHWSRMKLRQPVARVGVL